MVAPPPGRGRCRRGRGRGRRGRCCRHRRCRRRCHRCRHHQAGEPHIQAIQWSANGSWASLLPQVSSSSPAHAM